jgi:hypothetical protein
MSITVRMYSGTAPKKNPKAGDLKTLKDGTVMIRQQVHTGWGWQVSNGRPVWQWVVKGSDDDRMARIDRVTSGEQAKRQGGV